jgi:hypothetical protein
LPNSYDPRVDNINFEYMKQQSHAMRADIAGGVSKAKTHADFLSFIGAASNTEHLRAK